MTRDKVLHLIAGAVIALVVGLAVSPMIGLLTATLAGVAKEVWDSFGNGAVEAWDALATILGGALIYGVMLCA